MDKYEEQELSMQLEIKEIEIKSNKIIVKLAINKIEKKN